MENFDFSTEDKMRVLFTFKVKPKRYMFSTIIFNFLLSFFTLAYLMLFFRIERSFNKNQLFVLEVMNIMLTLLLFWMYNAVSTNTNIEGQRILYFYFYFTIVYLMVFVGHSVGFFLECMTFYMNRAYKPKTVFTIIEAFVPLTLVMGIKVSQQISYYFASKIIE